MKRKDKNKLIRIVISACLLIFAALDQHLLLIPKLISVGGFDIQALLFFAIPYAIIGWDILFKAARNIACGQIFDENFLMSLATLCAFATGEYAEAVFVMLFYQTGEFFQSIAVGKSRKSIKSLLSIRADAALVERGGEIAEIACEDVEVGDIIEVNPGGKIPLDGTIIEGHSSINTVALTGESLPREVSVGDSVLSGCVNLQGLLRIKVTVPFGESTVSKILRLVEESTASKSKSERFITKFAKIYTPAVVLSALLLGVLPPLFLGISNIAIWREWIMRAMTFLVISCPCALVISVPLAYFGGIGAASANGILIKGSNYLDALSACDTVVFDKTGTLTEGVFKVTEISPVGISDSELLTLAAVAEKHSTHPIALSLIDACESQDLSLLREVAEIEEMPGLGIRALSDKKKLLVGNLKLMEAEGVQSDEKPGIGTLIHVAFDGKYLGYIRISDRIKENAANAISDLKRIGIKNAVMLTGDKEAEARRVADILKVSYCAELLPQDKVGCFEKIMSEAEGCAAFVGDGINDAPVIARADVGIAMGALGSDAAIEAADIVIMNDSLDSIPKAMTIAKRTRKIVVQNIVFALAVKAIALILGALGIVGLGIAVFADVGVAVIAILNSMRNLKK